MARMEERKTREDQGEVLTHKNQKDFCLMLPANWEFAPYLHVYIHHSSKLGKLTPLWLFFAKLNVNNTSYLNTSIF